MIEPKCVISFGTKCMIFGLARLMCLPHIFQTTKLKPTHTNTSLDPRYKGFDHTLINSCKINFSSEMEGMAGLTKNITKPAGANPNHKESIQHVQINLC